jgi:hypothetical protein
VTPPSNGGDARRSALGEDAVLLGALATALGTARDVVFERRSGTS